MTDGHALSADAIEQIFDAARAGNDLPEAKTESRARRGRRVREIDFARPSKFSPDIQRRFERSHQGFCRSISTQLGAELRMELELEVIDLDQLALSTALASVPQPSLYGLIETEPLGTTIILAVELPLMLRMADRLLGGTGELKTLRPELTEIEMAIVRRLFRTIVAPLSLAWDELLGVTLHLRDVESKLTNVPLASPSEPTLTITFEAASKDTSETLALTIPYRAIETALEAQWGAAAGGRAVDPAVREQVQTAVSAAEIDLRVEAAAITLELDEVLALGPGDIVRLDVDAGADVTVFAGLVPIHRARPGRSGTKRAVEIVGRAQSAR